MQTQMQLITVINSAGPTSMPLHEFVLFRHNRRMDRAHAVIASTGGAWVDEVRALGVDVIVAGDGVFDVPK